MATSGHPVLVSLVCILQYMLRHPLTVCYRMTDCVVSESDDGGQLISQSNPLVPELHSMYGMHYTEM